MIARLRWHARKGLVSLAAVRWRWALGGFGAGSELGRPELLVNPTRITIGSGVFIRAGARLEVVPPRRLSAGEVPQGQLIIEDDVRIEGHVHLGAAELVRIGAGTVLASHVYVTDHDHGRPSQPGERIMDMPLTIKPTVIGKDAWIGERAIILKGITVGDGAIVGAGAVVTKDVPAGATVVGTPARVVER